MKPKTCQFCKFWDDKTAHTNDIGPCNRYPPVAIYPDKQYLQADNFSGPITYYKHCCGEFAPIKTKPIRTKKSSSFIDAKPEATP